MPVPTATPAGTIAAATDEQSTAVAVKALRQMKQEGQAALTLIETAVPPPDAVRGTKFNKLF